MGEAVPAGDQHSHSACMTRPTDALPPSWRVQPGNFPLRISEGAAPVRALDPKVLAQRRRADALTPRASDLLVASPVRAWPNAAGAVIGIFPTTPGISGSGSPETIKSARLEASSGVITAEFVKQPGDPAWANDAEMTACLAFLKQYAADLNPADKYGVMGYYGAAMVVGSLKSCGDELTRENLSRQATHMRAVTVPMLPPGITLNTAPDDYSPIKQMQLQRFDGTGWAKLGGIVGGNGRGGVGERSIGWFVVGAEAGSGVVPRGGWHCHFVRPGVSSLAELERSSIVERTRAGVNVARNRRVKFGRKPKLAPDRLSRARKMPRPTLEARC
jgi:hypothetical protein